MKFKKIQSIGKILQFYQIFHFFVMLDLSFNDQNHLIEFNELILMKIFLH
jgi:hypothetical protein